MQQREEQADGKEFQDEGTISAILWRTTERRDLPGRIRLCSAKTTGLSEGGDRKHRTLLHARLLGSQSTIQSFRRSTAAEAITQPEQYQLPSIKSSAVFSPEPSTSAGQPTPVNCRFNHRSSVNRLTLAGEQFAAYSAIRQPVSKVRYSLKK